MTQNRGIYFGPFRMDLGQGTLALPTGLFLNGTNVLKPKDSCVESLAGVSLYPAATAVGDIEGGVNERFDVLLQGPAVLRVSTTFSVPYSCGGTQQTLSGKTTYSFFPSTRVIRREENLIGATSPLANSSGCSAACSPGVPFHFTSFWAFLESQVVDAQGRTGTVIDAPACVIVEGHTIAVKYDGTSTQAGNFHGGAIVSRDMTPEMEAWPAMSPLGATSRMMIAYGDDPTKCGELIAGLQDPPVAVDGEVVPVEDGVYLATDKPHRGRVEIQTPASIPYGFALQIDLGGARHVRVYYNEMETNQYALEFDGAHPIFWLPPLLGADVIALETLD